MSEDRIDIALAEAYEGGLSAAKGRISELEAQVAALQEEILKKDADHDRVLLTMATERDGLRSALADMLSGWKYIRSTHGDLYGVGWDRAQGKAEAALQAQERRKGERRINANWSFPTGNDRTGKDRRKQPAQGMVAPCEWDLTDEDNGIWESDCGKTWTFIDGGPIENEMAYCHGCGKPVKVTSKEPK